MRNRVITVPKDKIAEMSLSFDKATKEQLIELSITEEEFLFLYQKGIFELINLTIGTNIDDFEDDAVTGKDNLSKIIRVLNLRGNLNNNESIKSLSKLFYEAVDRDTGVYFYF